MRLDIKLDSANLRRLRTLAATSKLSAAKALTFSALEAQKAWRTANKRVFKLRREAFIQGGIRINAATPGNLNAQVGSIDRFMGRHIVGIGEPKRGHLFVPVYGNIADAKTHTAMRRTLRSADDSQRKTFQIRTSSGKILIVRRRGKARSPLQILGVVQEGAKIEPHLDALDVVARVVNVQFGPIYERLLLKALEAKASPA